MTPRYLGCAAVISRSFARIYETNLKKQGVLTLTFKDPLDYNKIMEDDRISITGLNNIKRGKPVKCVLYHNNNIELKKRYIYNTLIMNYE
jgi:aconitate hydratase